MDADGYPDDEELEQINNWPYKDFEAMMDFIRERWQYAECGYWEQDGNKYKISTAGWSGNEDMIGAMMENRIFWSICWVSSRRGGHYEFELRG